MMTKQELKRMIDAASGRVKADLVIKNGNVVDVCNGKILQADVAITAGHVVGLGRYDGETEYDAKGAYISPGLMDAHIHIESSYCTPEEFGRMVIPHGTTTVVADPHEIVNVCGIEGFDYMAKAAKATPLCVKLMVPSCVPATAIEDAGAVIKAKDMVDSICQEFSPGLGELMDYVAVRQGDEDVLDKVLLAKHYGKVIDGHSPNVYGYDLNAYICAGVKTDHECSTLEEMKDRLERGVYVQLRQGSACHNLEQLAPGITAFNFRRCLICSDDRQPKTIFEEGHLENHLRMLVKAGIDPIMAIAMATVNVADCYHFEDRGMIAPGKKADLVIFEDLESFQVRDVFIDGEHVASRNTYLKEIEKTDIASVSGTMHIKDFSEDKLVMNLTGNKIYAIEVVPGEVLSKKAVVEIRKNPQNDFEFDPKIDVVKCAVLERHHETGKIGLGFLKNYGMKCGAIAASVAHDSHNVICVGVCNEEMAVAIDAMIKQKGGFVIVKDGHVIESLPLPVAGLMSDLEGEVVSEKLVSLHNTAICELGVNSEIEPLMTLTFMSLNVIPELKITARGMFDVIENRFIGLEANE